MAPSGISMKRTGMIISIAIALAITTLTSCQRPVDRASQCVYIPWSIEEYQLFGLTKEQILSMWPVEFSRDGDSVFFNDGKFNLEFDQTYKVRAVQRFFVGCKQNYYGPWLQSQEEALDYCVTGLKSYTDPKSIAKLQTAQQRLESLRQLKSGNSKETPGP